MFTVYCWLLCLYPGSYRDEFYEEMTSLFHDAQSTLPPALAVKISFCRREFCGLVWGALCAHFDHLFGPGVRFWRFDMQSQFRVPRSTVFLMLVIFAGVMLTIAKASNVAGDTLGSARQQLVGGWPWNHGSVFVLVFMLLSMCTAAGVVWGILHGLRRSGVHRLENLQSWMNSAESNDSR